MRGRLFNVIYWLFGFLRMGTSGMTSQALGRRDFAEVLKEYIEKNSPLDAAAYEPKGEVSWQ